MYLNYTLLNSLLIYIMCPFSRKGLIPEAKGEVTLTETLNAEVGVA
jgi:hypothetical protein